MTEPVLGMADILAAIDAIRREWDAPPPRYYAGFVHPDCVPPMLKAYAALMGSPIRRHARATAMRKRKRALMRDWRPNHLQRSPDGLRIFDGYEIHEQRYLPRTTFAYQPELPP